MFKVLGLGFSKVCVGQRRVSGSSLVLEYALNHDSKPYLAQG